MSTSAVASTTVLGVATRFLSELQVGDVIAVSSDPTDYATVVSIESDTSLTVNLPIGDGTASSITVRRTEPITLVHLARQPNGRTAQIVGTPSTLYRYEANEDGAYYRDAENTDFYEGNTYFDGDYFAEDANTRYFAASGSNAYFEESAGAWRIIGRNFSKSGSRWEALNINGWSVFNNGVDLPVSYRVEEQAVAPLYELRENGIAYVGNIAEFSGILMLGDIGEIKEGRLPELFAHESSESITASQAGSVNSGMIKAHQVGSTDQVVATAAIFTSGMVGRKLSFANGFSSVILSFQDTTHVTLTNTPTPVGATNLVFFVIDEAADYLLTASGEIFTPAMRGRGLYFAGGVSRQIVEVVSSTVARVNTHLPIAAQTFLLENQTAYGRFDNEALLNRIGYRLLWSMPGLPTRFAAVNSGGIAMGSKHLELDYPVKSLAVGMELTIVGAGLEGGNHSSTILFIGDNRTSVTLAEAAQTTVTGALFQASDAVGSIVGYEDLQDDSSAIVKMLALKNAFVIYKDTSIFICRYTAIPEQPFDFGQQGAVYRGRAIPTYRNTLISLDDNIHFYAGPDHFYVFDLVSRTPQEHRGALQMQDLFYGQVSLAQTNRIWAANNSLTQEIFVGLPLEVESEDKLLCFDYSYSTFSSSSMPVTAGAIVKRPVSGRASGVVEDWFVMGDGGGRVLLYGRCDEPQEQWGGALAIWHRAGESYDSLLRAGMWGSNFGETDLIAYLPELSSFEAPTPAQVELTILGYRNAAELPRKLAVVLLEAPSQYNAPQMFFRAFYFQDQLRVSGQNNPCRLAARTIQVAGVNSQSFGRVKP